MTTKYASGTAGCVQPGRRRHGTAKPTTTSANVMAPAARTSQTGRAVEPGDARSSASSVIRANGTNSLTRAAADTER